MIEVTGLSASPLVPRLYSYWSNSVRLGNDVLLFVGHADNLVRFYRVSLETGAVEALGPKLPYGGTGEGWYINESGFVTLCAGPRLVQAHPLSGDERTLFDISETHPGCDLWQVHSDDAGRTHSATVRRLVYDGAYPKLGTVVCRDGQQTFYRAQGTLDESQISRDGRFLVIKEDDDNRIITLDTGEIRMIRDADGALGHSDCGPDFVVGEDNQIGACVCLQLDTLERRTLFSTWNMGHLAVRGGRCLLSGDRMLSLVALDGSGVTPLVEHGQIVTSYDTQVQGTLTPDGSVACWMANGGLFLLDLGR